MPICLALAKYEYSCFSLEILEYCEPSELLKKEKYYFNLLNPEYNISKDPAAPMSGNKHSKVTLAKMRIAKLNKKLSEETKALISFSMLSSIKVRVLDKETNTTVDYDSITAAAIALNIRIQAICNYLKRNQIKPYKGRYIFQKI